MVTEGTKKDNRGGAREGAGRPRIYPQGSETHKAVRVTAEAYARIKDVANKTEYVSNLILAQN